MAGGHPGRRAFQLGLRGRLVALVLVVLAPLLLLQAVHLAHAYRRHMDRELQAQRELASGVVVAFSYHLRGIWNSAAALGDALAGAGKPPDPAAVEVLLQARLADYPTVHALAWLNPDGRVLAATDPVRPGADLGTLPSIRRILAGARRAVSDLTTVPGSELPAFALALGVGPPDRRSGVVVAWMDPAALVRILPLPQGQMTRYGLIDSQGHIVYDNSAPWSPPAQRLLSPGDPGHRALQGHIEISPRLPAAAGAPARMGAAFPVPGTGWAAFATATLADVRAGFWQRTLHEVAILITVAALALVAAVSLGRQLLAPIRALQRAASAIAGGNLAVRADGAGGGPELALAQRTFNEMADRIQSTEEQLEAESARCDMERRRLRAVLELLPVGVCIYDRHGHLIETNATAAAMHASHPPAAAPGSALARALERGEMTVDEERKVEGAGGERRITLHSAVPVRDEAGAVAGAVLVYVDVTSLKRAEAALQAANLELETRVRERTADLASAVSALHGQIAQRQRAEAALRESERRLRAVFNQTFQFMGLMHPDGTMLEINQTALTFFGLTRSDVVDRPIWLVPWWNPGTAWRRRLQAVVGRAAAGHFVRFEARVQSARRQAATVDFSIQPVRDDEGRVVLLIPEGRDITVIKRAEAAVRARKAVQERERLRARFLQVAAHELRNPMAAVKGLAALLRRRAASGRSLGDVERLAGLMEREMDRLSALLDEVLESFCLQEGQLPLSDQEIHLAALVSAALAPLAATAPRHRLVFAPPEVDLRVRGDPKRLEGVVRNLVSNAIKYSPDGGDIQVRLTARGERALLSVQDPGIGIPGDQLDHIFEGFCRGSNLTERDPGGLGLGLYICREVVRRHGGRIWAESAVGQGTTFYVELPLAGAAAAGLSR